MNEIDGCLRSAVSTFLFIAESFVGWHVTREVRVGASQGLRNGRREHCTSQYWVHVFVLLPTV